MLRNRRISSCQFIIIALVFWCALVNSVLAAKGNQDDAEKWDTKQGKGKLKKLMKQLDHNLVKQVQRFWIETTRGIGRLQQQRQQKEEQVGRALHLSLDSKVSHEFIENRRVGHACFGEQECHSLRTDVSQESDSSVSTTAICSAFVGMKLQVFQHSNEENNARSKKNIPNNNGLPLNRHHLPASAFDERKDNMHNIPYDYYFIFQQAYQLVEPLHLELGTIPRHYLDFAYTPVMEQRHEFKVYDEEEDDDYDDIVTVRDSHSSTGNKGEDTSILSLSEENSCKAVVTEDEDSRVSSSWWRFWFPFTNPWWKTRGSKPNDFDMGKTAFAGGSHGEVWRGRRICQQHDVGKNCNENSPQLILKRLKVERGYRLLEAGLREIYFGNWIVQQEHQKHQALFTTYVDHFFREVPRAFGRKMLKDLELWIVFEDAGPSLRSYLYTPVNVGGFVMYQHSQLWAQIRMTNMNNNKGRQNDDGREYDDTSVVVSTTFQTRNASGSSEDNSHAGTSENPSKPKKANIGKDLLQSVLRQILAAAAYLHEHGIVHRDIKPSNVMCNSDVPLNDLYVLEELPDIHCVLGDFSSAWDEYSNESLYTKGPSPGEQTDEYAPPESYIGDSWIPFQKAQPQSYDSWSIGVLALELLLGTPNVFSVDQRTTVLLTKKMKKEGASDEELQRALYLAALSHYCIYVPASDSTKQQAWPLRHGDPLHKTAMVTESCTLQDFHRALRARDPLGIGFDSSTDLLLHLIWQLLAWDPMERMTASEALQHPYFTSPENNKGLFNNLNMLPGHSYGDALPEGSSQDPEDTNVREFVCPKCGRIFQDWQSCHKHANSRRHAKFCMYDRKNLPTCINTHSMLPAHPTSGYCDLQGRRPTIEDFHSIHLHSDVQFYGIFDGHTGNLASKYVASKMYEQILMRLPSLHSYAVGEVDDSTQKWKVEVQENVSQAFREIHDGFLEAVSLSSSRSHMDQSGTTATALLVTDEVIIVSHLGDSRAVLSSTTDGALSAIQLTKDHVASDPGEKEMVLERGGSVSPPRAANGIARVNGTLAITRSIGDANLAPILSREPHVVSWTRDEIRKQCGDFADFPSRSRQEEKRIGRNVPCFVVLASDGLWDVMSNEEAVLRVVETVESYDTSNGVSWNNGGAFQEAAEILAIDAYVRGSTDNIGVCVVAVD